MSFTKKLNGVLGCCLLIACTCFLFSCKISKNITKEDYLYFQTGIDSIKKVQVAQPVIHVNDLISVQVSSPSLNQEQTIPFNLPASATGTGVSGYLVNSAGNIEMPVLGSIKAAGLTQDQLQKNITEKLTNYVKDPAVMVHFLQFKVNVLGEVKNPGVQKFDVDRVTLIDAISAAGDLSDKGKREDITVIREDGVTRRIYKVDIRSGSLFQSPAYMLQSNDIVYVGASDQKFKELKNTNSSSTLQGLQIFGTILGLFTSVIFAFQIFK